MRSKCGSRQTKRRPSAPFCIPAKRFPCLRRRPRRLHLRPRQKQDDQRPRQRERRQREESRCRVAACRCSNAADHVGPEVPAEVADRVDQRDAGGRGGAAQEGGGQ